MDGTWGHGRRYRFMEDRFPRHSVGYPLESPSRILNGLISSSFPRSGDRETWEIRGKEEVPRGHAELPSVSLLNALSAREPWGVRGGLIYGVVGPVPNGMELWEFTMASLCFYSWKNLFRIWYLSLYCSAAPKWRSFYQ